MSVDYSIRVLFDASDLPALYSANLKLCMSKGTVSVPGSNPLPLIWVAADPFEGNIVNWSEMYNMYVSNSTVQAGATITQLSETVGGVEVNLPYIYSNGIFTSDGPQIPVPNGFSVINKSGHNYVFGLEQTAIVDGNPVLSPIMGNVCLNNYTSTFFPTEQITVFMLANAASSTCVQNIYDSSVVVNLTAAAPNATLKYNSTLGTFIPVPNIEVRSNSFLTVHTCRQKDVLIFTCQNIDTGLNMPCLAEGVIYEIEVNEYVCPEEGGSLILVIERQAKHKNSQWSNAGFPIVSMKLGQPYIVQPHNDYNYSFVTPDILLNACEHIDYELLDQPLCTNVSYVVTAGNYFMPIRPYTSSLPSEDGFRLRMTYKVQLYRSSLCSGSHIHIQKHDNLEEYGNEYVKFGHVYKLSPTSKDNCQIIPWDEKWKGDIIHDVKYAHENQAYHLYNHFGIKLITILNFNYPIKLIPAEPDTEHGIPLSIHYWYALKLKNTAYAFERKSYRFSKHKMLQATLDTEIQFHAVQANNKWAVSLVPGLGIKWGNEASSPLLSSVIRMYPKGSQYTLSTAVIMKTGSVFQYKHIGQNMFVFEEVLHREGETIVGNNWYSFVCTDNTLVLSEIMEWVDQPHVYADSDFRQNVTFTCYTLIAVKALFLYRPLEEGIKLRGHVKFAVPATEQE